MKSGSKEHKAQFVEEKLKILNENIWETEILELISEAELTTAKGEVAKKRARVEEIEEKMMRKEYPSANAGHKELDPAKEELKEAEENVKRLDNVMQRLHEDTQKNEAMIERFNKWQSNGKTKQV